jgi:F-box/leucine-rich repeat protein 2/20
MNLLDLPEDPLSLLLGYLHDTELATLDTAVCSTLHRTHYLRCIQHITQTYITTTVSSIKKLAWVSLRGLYVTSVIGTIDNHTDNHTVSLTHSLHNFKFKFPHLTHLNLSKSTAVTNKVLLSIAKGSPKLTHINLSHCMKFDDEGLVHVAQGCPLLTHLDVSECVVSDDGMLTLALNCKRLTNVYVPQCTYVTGKTMDYLLTHCLNLSHLDLSFSCGMHWSSLRESPLSKNCNALLFLDLGNAIIIDDELLAHVCSASKNLLYLYLSNCESVTDEGVRLLASECHCLVSLDLSGCGQLTDDSMKYISLGCQQLTHLNISQCDEVTASGLQYLQQGCLFLCNLDFTGCTEITEEDLQYLPVGCRQISHKYRASEGVSSGGFQFSFDIV